MNKIKTFQFDSVETKSMRTFSEWKIFLFGVVPPLLIAVFLYFSILKDDLFGDEFLQYRWSVLGESPYGSLLIFDINAQFAKLGYLLFREPWALRLHSIIFSLGAIILIYIVAKHLFGTVTAIFATWLAALSPYILEFAAEARPNAIFIFAGIFFLYSLLLLLQNENWLHTFLLAFSACFGLLARPMFISIFIFGIGYYIFVRRKITRKLIIVMLSVIPCIFLIGYQMAIFSTFGPKEPSDVPVLVSNLLLRLPVAFTYGYSTMNYPERDIGWNIAVSKVLLHNPGLFIICMVVFCALIIGFIQFFKKDRNKSIFLAGAVFFPILIMIAIQETGFSILNEKHCAGVVGAWYILLAAGLVQTSRYLWGKFAIALYIFLIGISLYHFYFQPEIYSRRSNFTALNSFLTETINEDDVLLAFHFSPERVPDYLPVLDNAGHYVDLYSDIPHDITVSDYVASKIKNCIGKIYLIYDSRLRPGIDPDNDILSFLKNHYEYKIKNYGRNLKLYEFSEQKLISEHL